MTLEPRFWKINEPSFEIRLCSVEPVCVGGKITESYCLDCYEGTYYICKAGNTKDAFRLCKALLFMPLLKTSMASCIIFCGFMFAGFMPPLGQPICFTRKPPSFLPMVAAVAWVCARAGERGEGEEFGDGHGLGIKGEFG
ncbi:hypothetical protein TL16_g10177 [Triparma laevis f. inornata]|uniref:Uncharacterized protein n=1 Tax=Triparma laevis f. inornata TaxID=1714386 RepID=A0A9W7B6X0_9STRA|nr:hypothetical protein TL16_g10177 [Triparma laevis f. inornata]